MNQYQLLGVGSDAKTPKGESFGYLTGILYLAPAKLSGFEVCPWRTEGCTEACLNTSGRGKFESTQQARIRKTRWFFSRRDDFMRTLNNDLRRLSLDADIANLKPCARLNATSDIAWELGQRSEQEKSIIQQHPSIEFYDYTKSVGRVRRMLAGEFPKNYRLTFSHSGENLNDCLDVLARGGNVAVVFGGTMPTHWHGHRVIDGDIHDLRFLDERGTVVGLKPKGKAKQDASGFVVRDTIVEAVAA